jgi:hypothetical protein
MLINYQSDPEKFSNSAIIDLEIINTLGISMECERINPMDLIYLAILAEAIILNNELIVKDEWSKIIYWEDDIERYGRSEFAEDLLVKLFQSETIGVNFGSAANILDNEITLFVPRSGLKLEVIHDSCIFYDTKNVIDSEDALLSDLNKDITKRMEKVFNNTLFNNIKKQGIDKDDNLYGGKKAIETYWKILADCHGVPVISSNFDTYKVMKCESPTNIGYDLYNRLEKFHTQFFSDIKKYLGPTYVRIPSILAIVFNEMKRIDEFPSLVVQFRDTFSKFRNQCYKLELELRNANDIKIQYSIWKEIENCYSSIAEKYKSSDTRVINKLFDIGKQIDPLSMITEALNYGNQKAIEREGLLKIPGYYNLWNTSFKVNQASNDLRRIFGKSINNDFISSYNKILSLINEN